MAEALNGNCRGMETNAFYEPSRWAEAAKACADCPVLLECRMEFAGDPYAFAGGMTPERRASWHLNNRTARRRRRPDNGGPRSPREKVDDELRSQIIAIWHADLIGPKAIADQVGLAKSTVQRVLRAANLTRTPEQLKELARRGGLSGGQQRQGERNKVMVLSLLADNYTPQEVAKITGLTLGHVYVIRRKAADG